MIFMAQGLVDLILTALSVGVLSFLICAFKFERRQLFLVGTALTAMLIVLPEILLWSGERYLMIHFGVSGARDWTLSAGTIGNLILKILIGSVSGYFLVKALKRNAIKTAV